MAQHENDDQNVMIGTSSTTANHEHAASAHGLPILVHQASVAPPEALTRERLLELNSEARRNYRVKFGVLSNFLVSKPVFETFYFNQPEAVIADVPHDIRLEIFLEHFNSLANDDFQAKKSDFEQPLFITRMMWYYGLDPLHTFTAYYETVRYNIIGMAFLWGSGFEQQRWCDVDHADMVMGFISAWQSNIAQPARRELGDEKFAAEEAFIRLWKSCDVDLIAFKPNQLKIIRGYVSEIAQRSLPEHLHDVVKGVTEDMFERRDAGDVTDEDWEKYGPKMVIAWALMNHKDAVDYRATSTERAAAKASARTEEGKLEAREKANIDKANGGLGTVLAQVPWESNLLKALLHPVTDYARSAASNKHSKAATIHSNQGWMEPWDFIQMIQHASFVQEMTEMLSEFHEMRMKEDSKKAEDNEDMEMQD